MFFSEKDVAFCSCNVDYYQGATPGSLCLVPCYQGKKIIYLAYILRKLYIYYLSCAPGSILYWFCPLLLLLICTGNFSYVEYPAVKSWLRHFRVGVQHLGRPEPDIYFFFRHSSAPLHHHISQFRYRIPMSQAMFVNGLLEKYGLSCS